MYLVSLAQHSAWLGAAERPEKPSYSKRTARPQPRYMPACGAENGASYLSEGLSWSLLAMSPTVARRGGVQAGGGAPAVTCGRDQPAAVRRCRRWTTTARRTPRPTGGRTRTPTARP